MFTFKSSLHISSTVVEREHLILILRDQKSHQDSFWDRAIISSHILMPNNPKKCRQKNISIRKQTCKHVPLIIVLYRIGICIGLSSWLLVPELCISFWSLSLVPHNDRGHLHGQASSIHLQKESQHRGHVSH